MEEALPFPGTMAADVPSASVFAYLIRLRAQGQAALVQDGHGAAKARMAPSSLRRKEVRGAQSYEGTSSTLRAFVPTLSSEKANTFAFRIF